MYERHKKTEYVYHYVTKVKQPFTRYDVMAKMQEDCCTKHLTMSQVSKQLQIMEGRGWLVKVGTDGRNHSCICVYSLTAKGKELEVCRK